MTKDLKNLINLILKSFASPVLFSGNLTSEPEKIALHVAQSFLCKNFKKNDSFCNNCHSCNLFSGNSHPDIKVIERSKDRTQIQIKQIRDVSDFIYSTPLIAAHKIVLILNADQLNFYAQDTLLKSLEEPPKNLKFILTTSLPYKLKPTVLSRLTHYKLNPDKHSLNSDSKNDISIDINKNDYPEECWNKEEKVIRLFKDLVSLKGREIISFLIKDKDKDCLLIKLNWLSKIIEESILIHFTETLSDTPFAVLSKEIKNTLDIDTLIHLYDEILPMINSLQLNENLNYDFQTAAINY
jgi:hypothetical protein